MAILQILEYPDPRLRTRAEPVEQVDDDIRSLAADMLETMYAAPGIGLAATQVNVHRRVLVVDVSQDQDEPLVFINPQILEKDGIETMVGARGVKLSGGQLQRSAAARMFATEAELLVFDDLSSALDLHTEAELWNRLFEGREVTCLVVSHRREALQRADQILLMEGGCIVDRGTLTDLLARSQTMRDLWATADQE